MALRLTNIRLPIDAGQNKLLKAAAAKLRIPEQKINDLVIVKKAIDARRSSINFVYTVDVQVEHEAKLALKLAGEPNISRVLDEAVTPLDKGDIPLSKRPIIIGAGPAGIFAALTLAAYGYRPILLERGQDIDTRSQDVRNFWENRLLKAESNVQFGEGGAGTFSDGKLTTRINDRRIRGVLETFVDAGAPDEIKYLNKPHIGTDMLRKVVANLRHKLTTLGGEVIFSARVTDLLLEGEQVAGVEINGDKTLEAQVVVLAIGHSARDTYRMLYECKVAMESKPFAIGARIEHPQKLIDEAQYGKYAGHPKLGAADYQLVYKNKDLNRAAFSFCMCPGGRVVGATSEEEQVVTNGMSDFARDTGIANSALVVSVNPEDYPGNSPLAGIEFQRQWEGKAYTQAGGNYNAPAQRVEDFLGGRPSSNLPEIASYQPGLTPADLHDCLPGYVTEMMEEAIVGLNRKLKNFNYPDAVLTGVETRTSAPLRILRGADHQSVNIKGLYPAGEGAGYAGGIMSAAVDGIKVAEAIISAYLKGD